MQKPVTELDANVPEEETADARGWEGLAEWTGDLPPDQIEALAAVREGHYEDKPLR